MALSYSLPPNPPMGGNDIRFSGDTKLCGLDDCVIEVMNGGHPVTLNFNISNGEKWELVPIIPINQLGEKAITLLIKGKSLWIQVWRIGYRENPHLLKFLKVFRCSQRTPIRLILLQL